jgi:neuroligin
MSGSTLSPLALNHQAGKLKGEVARQMDCERFAGSDGAASAEQMS